MPVNKPVKLPTERKPIRFGTIKRYLATAAQVIIAAPVKLPKKVVAGARYVALVLGLLDALTGPRQPEEGDDDAN